MKKLYALLIGINEYQAGTGVRNLSACVNDVNAMQSFLQAHYQSLLPDIAQIKVLTNNEATRHNVITAFQQHLTQASAEDTVLIYYSGHGSHGIAAPELEKYRTGAQEQSWVLHDSRTVGQYDLADKEIALLLNEIGQKKPHIVVISDSCFSASITKSIESFQQLRARFTPSSNEPRPLDSYLNGAYSRRVAQGDKSIPSTKHLLLSASNEKEVAYEGGKRGVFSNFLLKILEKNAGQTSYNRLFIETRALVQAEGSQHPQCEAHNDFNTQEGFLGLPVPDAASYRYPIRRNAGNQWIIDMGVASGLQLDSNASINIYDASHQGNLIGEAKISQSNVTQSLLSIENTLLDNSKIYYGEPKGIIFIPFYVYADENAMPFLLSKKDTWENSIYFVSDKSQRFHIIQQENSLIFRDSVQNNDIETIALSDDKCIEKSSKLLIHLAHWEKTLRLKNPKTNINLDDLKFTLKITQYGTETLFDSEIVELDYLGDGQNQKYDIPFKLIYENNRNLNFAIISLGSGYNITNRTNDLEQNTLENSFFTIGKEEIENYMLIVSTETIDTDFFALEKIGNSFFTKGRGISAFAEIKGERKVTPDWATKLISVRIRKKEAEKVGAISVNVGKGINFESHSQFRATLNKTSLAPKSKSVENVLLHHRLFRENPYFEIINLAKANHSKSVIDESIVELSIEAEGDLANEPLNLNINQSVYGESVLCLPFLFDGENFLPFGEMKAIGNNIVQFSLHNIPEEEAITKKSVLKALKLVFFKFVNDHVGKIFETHSLKRFNGIERIDNDIKGAVANAQKILLLVHGIIGDTLGMAQAFSKKGGNGYDLILTFDYENLQTSLEQDAKILKEKLQLVGISTEDNKEITIVAHSMGGLISRYMIEELDGNLFIDKLIMAGTPNGGSKFGSVPEFIGKLNFALALAVNFTPSLTREIINQINAVLKFTKDELLITLSQMSTKSDFIKERKSINKNLIPYSVFAGSLKSYLEKYPEQKKVSEKAVIQIGKWTYINEDNDTAVSIENIFAVPAEVKKIVPCHHLNYFQIEEVMEILVHEL